MADAPATPRRRFQFRLRTMLIGVTLLAVFCGYVARQAEIVRKRNSLYGLNERQFHPIHAAEYYGHGVNHHTVPWLRMWLGDREFTAIELMDGVDEETLNLYKAAFPEAKVYAFGEMPEAGTAPFPEN